VPAADVAVRAAKARHSGRKAVAQNEFYFLHQVAERSARRARP
jgi:hypothetical protein